MSQEGIRAIGFCTGLLLLALYGLYRGMVRLYCFLVFKRAQRTRYTVDGHGDVHEIKN